MNKQKRTVRRTGFTLMEVLLVLAILVIMGSLVGVYFAKAQKSAMQKSAQTQLSLFEDQLNLYHLDLNSYPSTAQGLAALRVRPADLANPQKWAGPYAEKDIPADPWDAPYQYESASADQYRIWSAGPDRQSGSDDDISVTLSENSR